MVLATAMLRAAIASMLSAGAGRDMRTAAALGVAEGSAGLLVVDIIEVSDNTRPG